MKFRRPRSLNGLILVGFGFVALPLLLAVIWALVNLDRVAEQSERLVTTGVSAAENNRRLEEQMGTLERGARQFQVLRNPNSLQIIFDDFASLQQQLADMAPLVAEADATELAESIGRGARAIVTALTDPDIDDEKLAAAIDRFPPMRQRVENLTIILSSYVDTELSTLQATARTAQKVSAWQVAALVPGTLILVLIFTFLVARPISHQSVKKIFFQFGLVT